MVIEISPKHLAILRPLIKGIGCAMCADKTLAFIADKGKKRLFLLFREGQFAGGHKEDGVEVIQVLLVPFLLDLGDGINISVDEGIPQATFAPQFLHRNECFRSGVVVKANRHADSHHPLLLAWRRQRLGNGNSHHCEQREESNHKRRTIHSTSILRRYLATRPGIRASKTLRWVLAESRKMARIQTRPNPHHPGVDQTSPARLFRTEKLARRSRRAGSFRCRVPADQGIRQ